MSTRSHATRSFTQWHGTPQPAPLSNIVEELHAQELEVVPWFFRFGRDRLAWVTLNGPEPLKSHIPKPDMRPETRVESGHLKWDWCLSPDYDYSEKPWRSYIPLKDEWLREGTQGWVFRKLIPEKIHDVSAPAGLILLHPRLKTQVQLTYRAVQLVYNAVNTMYQLYLPGDVELLPLDWVNNEFKTLSSLLSTLWDARRALLELFGWVIYHLVRDSDGWRKRKWEESFIDLVDKRLCFLSAPRRGCIINPTSISTHEVITLVRHEVPVHYQWKPRSNALIVDVWPEPSLSAARFDPYEFRRAHDYAAFTLAGGKYDNQAMNKSILGRSSAMSLSDEYLRHPRVSLFELPTPKDPGPGPPKKQKLRCFVRETVGGVLTEVSKKCLANLIDDEAGTVKTKQYPTGDFQLMTLDCSAPLGLHLTDLSKFFAILDVDASQSVDATAPSSITDSGSIIEPPDATAPPLSDSWSAIPKDTHVHTSQRSDAATPPLVPDSDSVIPMVHEEHGTHASSVDADSPINAMLINQISGQQPHSVKQVADQPYLDDDVISLGDEEEMTGTYEFLGTSTATTNMEDEVMELAPPQPASHSDHPSHRPSPPRQSVPHRRSLSPDHLSSLRHQRSPPPHQTNTSVGSSMSRNVRRKHMPPQDSIWVPRSECFHGGRRDRGGGYRRGEVRGDDGRARGWKDSRNETRGTPGHCSSWMRDGDFRSQRGWLISSKEHRGRVAGHGSAYMQGGNSSSQGIRVMSHLDRVPKGDSRRGASATVLDGDSWGKEGSWGNAGSGTSTWGTPTSAATPMDGDSWEQQGSWGDVGSGTPEWWTPTSTATLADGDSLMAHATLTCGAGTSENTSGGDRHHQQDTATPLATTTVGALQMLQRDAAIAFIRSSFPSSSTNTRFDSPAVNIDQITPSSIPDIIWREGQLTVPASTELRMRFWHLLDPQLSPSDLLTHCHTKGLPYCISSRTTSSNVSIPTLQCNKSDAHLIPQRRQDKVSPSMVMKYLENVRTVLSRPHAYKLLEQGGLIWRIVRHYSPAVYANAFTGRANGLQKNAGQDDPITPDEIQMLLGATANSNSFWPYPEWYEGSARYNGEWTAANEAWFIKHIGEINRAGMSSIRSGRQWQTNIGIYTSVQVSDPTTTGTMAHAQACCSHLVKEWPELWDSFHIGTLTGS